MELACDDHGKRNLNAQTIPTTDAQGERTTSIVHFIWALAVLPKLNWRGRGAVAHHTTQKLTARSFRSMASARLQPLPAQCLRTRKPSQTARLRPMLAREQKNKYDSAVARLRGCAQCWRDCSKQRNQLCSFDARLTDYRHGQQLFAHPCFRRHCPRHERVGRHARRGAPRQWCLARHPRVRRLD